MKTTAAMLICVLILSGCGRDNYYDIYGDLLKVNDINYICCNITAPDARIIGQEISRVKNKVESSKAVSGTFLGNGDSLSLKEGTVIHEITGIDVKDMIAVKWKDNRYIIYVNCERTDDIVNRLREDIEFAVGVRLRELIGESAEKSHDIYDFEIVNNIKKAFYNAEEYGAGLENFSKFYTIEFLIPDANGVYKPCLSILYRADGSFEYGFIYDNGIKLVNLNIRKIIE